MSIHSYQLLKNLNLSEGAVLRMLPTVNEQVFNAEQVIYHRASKDLPWSYIASGLVCAYLPSESTGLEPFCVHPQGDWFGEIDVIRNNPSTCEYVCLTEVRVTQLSGDLVRSALQSETEFAQSVLHMLAARHQTVLNFTFLSRIHTSELRVILGLTLLVNSLLSSAFGPSSSRVRANADEVELPIKQSMLASLCGVSRSALSLALRHPLDAGLCKVNYGRITFMQLASWTQLLETFTNSPVGWSSRSATGLMKQAKEVRHG